MSDSLILPFLLKCDPISGHSVNSIQEFFGQNRFITGSDTGELIIWKIKDDHFDPAVLMVPSLGKNTHEVKSLCTIQMPEPEILVSNVLRVRFFTICVRCALEIAWFPFMLTTA